MKPILLVLLMACSLAGQTQSGHVYVLNMTGPQPVRVDGAEFDLQAHSYMLRSLRAGTHTLEWRAAAGFWRSRWAIVTFNVEVDANYFFAYLDSKGLTFIQLSEHEGQGFIRDMQRQIAGAKKRERCCSQLITPPRVYLPPWDSFRR